MIAFYGILEEIYENVIELKFGDARTTLERCPRQNI
jgi:hypothetical protein